MQKLSYREAVRNSIRTAMQADEKVFLMGEDVGHDHLCFSDGKQTWSIRQGDCKLINSPGWDHLNYRLDENNIAHRADNELYPGGLLLFNLRSDIGETTDVSSKHPERVKNMTALYKAWRAEMGKPVSGKVRRPQ